MHQLARVICDTLDATRMLEDGLVSNHVITCLWELRHSRSEWFPIGAFYTLAVDGPLSSNKGAASV